MLTGLLLAAGESRRFGSPKLCEVLDGKPLVRWSAEALAPFVDEMLVVTGTHAAELREALMGLAVRFAHNPDPERGMGSSIATGVAALGDGVEAVLIALGDQPRPDARATRGVIERYRAGGVTIVAPSFNGVPGHPVLFGRALFGELARLSGDRGARPVVECDRSRVAIVPVDADAPGDVDVPADLAQLRASRS
jgi:molybdenum cofactor cytidylyltransferase